MMQVADVDKYETEPGEPGASARVMAVRLLAGLAQGALLYWLYRAGLDGFWPGNLPYLMTPLFMIGLMLPALLITSLGHMARKKTALWMLIVVVLLLVFSLHDVWRGAGTDTLFAELFDRPSRRMPSWLLIQFGAAFLFIAHALVMAGAADGRRFASYDSYFEAAWKLALQLLFSVVFVAALWLVLILGAGLFAMIKLDFLQKLTLKPWFYVPVICVAMSCAMHMTDVRQSIVRGIRTLLLMLLSWLLPVAVLLVCGFLCSLPFTGLDALWGTRHATSMLLTTDAVLIVLINAAFQNGQAKAALGVRISARIAATLLLPVTLVAIYALGLRVLDYGWTADRIVGAACLVVAGCYAVGYIWAAQSYDTWLCPIARVNVVAAFVVLAVLLALFTPIADPARLSVNDQMARLAAGRVTPDKFDFRYLRIDGKRYGQEALEQLARSDIQQLRDGATAALTIRIHREDKLPATAESIAKNITVWPASAKLPASFVAQKWSELPAREQPWCMQTSEQKCAAWLIDADGDGKVEILLFGRDYSEGQLYAEDEEGVWTKIAHLNGGPCDKPLERALKAGKFKLVTPQLKALEVGGRQLPFEPDFKVADCKAISDAK